MCARGILLTDISFDFVRSLIVQVGAATWPAVERAFAELRADALAWLDAEHVPRDHQRCRYAIDSRYDGQNFEVQVDMDEGESLSLATFARRFDEAHAREYGYQVPGRPVQIINCRLQAVGQVLKAPLAPARTDTTLADARIGSREVYHGKARGWHATPVYDRDLLSAGTRIDGPAVIEEMSSTTVIGPTHHAMVDTHGTLVISLEKLA